MSQKLCYKCREYFGAYSMTGLVNYLHCHHPEPEVKPNCWCEWEGEKRIQVHDYVRDNWNIGHYQIRATQIAKYCPACGKVLKEAV